jgi:hypothetical protein
MGKRTLGFSAFILVSVVLATLLFSGVVMGPPPESAPPVDFNVNVQNTPLPVEVTNPIGPPIATDCLTASISEGYTGTDLGWETVSHYNVVSGLGGKTVVFTGGGVSGGIVFTEEDGGGGAPAMGRVFVYDTELEMTQFALPLNSLYRMEDVDEIQVRVFASTPTLTGPSSYYASLTATVHWYIEA